VTDKQTQQGRARNSSEKEQEEFAPAAKSNDEGEQQIELLFDRE
jgi:hypothetical protein